MGFPAGRWWRLGAKKVNVSIPSRGLWVFPQGGGHRGGGKRAVSIPSRGLWVFPHGKPYSPLKGTMFQSLVGVYGFSRFKSIK